MATIQEQFTSFMPNISAGSVGLVFAFFFVALIVIIAVGIGTWYVIRTLKFNKDITLLEDVSGSDNLEPIGKDKAMSVGIGKGGLEILYLRKRKKYKGAYGKRMGKNKYYFGIGDDGYWYNVVLGSLKKGMQDIGIKPTSVNMRYQNESLMEIINQRYNQKNFFEKYGQFIMNMFFFILIALMFYLYFREFKSVAPAMRDLADTLKETAQALKEAIGGLQQLRSTGGIVPAG